MHPKKKSTSKHLFWCFRLSQIEDSIQYLEGPNGIWKHHDRHAFCPFGPQYACHGASRYQLVLPGTNIYLYLRKAEAPKIGALKHFFFLRAYKMSTFRLKIYFRVHLYIQLYGVSSNASLLDYLWVILWFGDKSICYVG